jgi:ubiquinone/menaquinone biosynthesis C-methylase UbiE
MSTEPLREQESTYLVQDRANREEVARLEILDKMMTAVMGGVLEEVDDPTLLRRVLDVGCGPGGWLMETARAYPMIEELVGVDISCMMVKHAREGAETLGLDERVNFRTMDALRILDFPEESFDLVNQRAGLSWLRTWEWRKVLLEYQRVTRPGGIVRITEGSIDVESNSPALTALWDICLDALYRSGRLFTKSGDGVTGKLVSLMAQYGIQDMKYRVYTPVYQAGTVEHQSFYEDMRRTFRILLPFFQKWAKVPSNYEEIYQQALKEMCDADFVARGTLLTAWGIRPGNDRLLRMGGLR